MNFLSPTTLGHTGLQVGRLGLASSYGAPAQAFEEAFERGCNYFVWNSFMKGRSKEMQTAIRNIIKAGKRDQLVIALHSYGHNRILNKFFLQKSLRMLGVETIEVMLLGYYSWKPASPTLHSALKLKEQGLVKHIGLTGHNRKLIARLAGEGEIDVFHTRYNAVHTGAEKDIFPHLNKSANPGMVAFTATSWGQLLDPRRMPAGQAPLKASDCYRFALSNPYIDVCLTAPKTREQMRENLETLNLGPLNQEEMQRIREIGQYVYRNK